MAVREAEWTYSSDGRIAFVFLAFAIVLLALGLLAVTAFGSDAANAGAAWLGIAISPLVLPPLVSPPPLARRGAASFSVYPRRSVDEAVMAVREAIEASGKTAQVDVVKSRSDHPPRIITAEGIPSRFRIEVTRHPAGAEGGLEWTEIVESSASRDGEEAQALRRRVTELLAGGAPPAGWGSYTPIPGLPPLPPRPRSPAPCGGGGDFFAGVAAPARSSMLAG